MKSQPRKLGCAIFKRVCLTINNSYQSRLIWGYYTHKHRTIALNVRPLLTVLRLKSDQENNVTLEAAMFLKNTFKAKKKLADIPDQDFPKRIISKPYKSYLFENDVLKRDQYEFLVYLKLRDAIEKNQIYLNDTLQFKAFSEDIKTTKPWKKHKEEILEEIGNPKLSDSIDERLGALQETLEQLYIDVNKRIDNGENEYVKITDVNGKKEWTLEYPEKQAIFDHPFYRSLPLVDISDVFDLVDKLCPFMHVFTHINPKNSKRENNYQYTKANIIASGTRQSTEQMAARSNLDLNPLKTNQANCIRVETLRNACDKLNQGLKNNTAFKRCNYSPDIYHGSIDGSKHGVVRHTAKARFGPKYFGLDKGMVALNMILNGSSLNAIVIGANEHESHYSFDLCFNNTSGLSLDRLSTDTAGNNQTSFLFLDLLNIDYAPCFKSFSERIKTIGGFLPTSHYKDMLIKPSRCFDRSLITNQWPDMQEVMAAMLMKETSQNVIVKKLASHKYKSKLKRAIWEYNRILFSIYMLRYVDGQALQRSVRIALNRGEGYHKIYNAVSKVGGKKFRGGSDLDVEISHQCTRLITLVIVYYNFHLLAQVIEQKIKAGDEKAAKLLATISTLAKRHINLSGVYHYDADSSGIDVDAIISTLEEVVAEIIAKAGKENKE